MAPWSGRVHPGFDWHWSSEARQAHGPFVYRQIASNSVAGAVIVVQSDLPERSACEGVEMGTTDPRGNTRVAMAIWPFNTRVACSRTSWGGTSGPVQSVRVMSVVPSRYCAPESSGKLRWADWPVAVLCDAVVVWRRARPRPRSRESFRHGSPQPVSGTRVASPQPTFRFRCRAGRFLQESAEG